ncbi:MAG TPA: PQQ-dependent sugar dehydrogenase [Solirubrobacterales bacterium]|nr:PQQ-dependent sugar dehydrogenase [Solirubrobacterales bacterium]
MSRAVGKFVLALGLLLALAGGSAQAASLQTIGTGFDEPIFVTSDPGNPNRLFVVEREGRIVEVAGDSRTVFADLRGVVGCGNGCGGERGLLSIALSPDFDTSGRLFVDYAEDPEPGDIHVGELNPTGGLRNLLTIPHPDESNHNGGQLQFGPEGNLFVSTGDGGGEDDQHHNAQNLSSLLGKILRIGINPSGALPYTVPAGNPFAAPAPYDTIWAYGLRNPFRFSFDRGGSGLWIGDVGQSAREEIDFAPAPGLGAGFNFGWNCEEGSVAGPGDDEGCAGAAADAFVGPVFDYPHSDPGDGGASGCAVIGGYVSRDPGVTELYGRYIYGDLCVNKIRSFSPAQPLATDRSEGLQISNLNSFGEDSCGRLYAISGSGAVYRIVGAGPTTCPTAATPSLSPSFVGIRALRRRVKKNRRALLTAYVSPCKGRQGDPVTLWRGRKKLGTRHFDRVCTARFRPRISRRSSFRVTVKANATYVAAISRKLTVKIKKRHRHHR